MGAALNERRSGRPVLNPRVIRTSLCKSASDLSVFSFLPHRGSQIEQILWPRQEQSRHISRKIATRLVACDESPRVSCALCRTFEQTPHCIRDNFDVTKKTTRDCQNDIGSTLTDLSSSARGTTVDRSARPEVLPSIDQRGTLGHSCGSSSQWNGIGGLRPIAPAVRPTRRKNLPGCRSSCLQSVAKSCWPQVVKGLFLGCSAMHEWTAEHKSTNAGHTDTPIR
jgi:hypothetical protein